MKYSNISLPQTQEIFCQPNHYQNNFSGFRQKIFLFALTQAYFPHFYHFYSLILPFQELQTYLCSRRLNIARNDGDMLDWLDCFASLAMTGCRYCEAPSINSGQAKAVAIQWDKGHQGGSQVALRSSNSAGTAISRAICR